MASFVDEDNSSDFELRVIQATEVEDLPILVFNEADLSSNMSSIQPPLTQTPPVCNLTLLADIACLAERDSHSPAPPVKPSIRLPLKKRGYIPEPPDATADCVSSSLPATENSYNQRGSANGSSERICSGMLENGVNGNRLESTENYCLGVEIASICAAEYETHSPLVKPSSRLPPKKRRYNPESEDATADCDSSSSLPITENFYNLRGRVNGSSERICSGMLENENCIDFASICAAEREVYSPLIKPSSRLPPKKRRYNPESEDAIVGRNSSSVPETEKPYNESCGVNGASERVSSGMMEDGLDGTRMESVGSPFPATVELLLSALECEGHNSSEDDTFAAASMLMSLGGAKPSDTNGSSVIGDIEQSSSKTDAALFEAPKPVPPIDWSDPSIPKWIIPSPQMQRLEAECYAAFLEMEASFASRAGESGPIYDLTELRRLATPKSVAERIAAAEKFERESKEMFEFKAKLAQAQELASSLQKQMTKFDEKLAKNKKRRKKQREGIGKREQ